ncbi:MAG: hypothetical protein Q9217_004620 [Psora testacea]
MPLKDPRYEYVRSRPRKEKDRDHERETRSVGGSSTTTTIRDRKHRNSITSNPTGSSETASQASATLYQDMPLEQLPPLPETEESESASTATSPIVRTNSNITNPTSRNSPSQIDTPAKLQPYLESVCDTASTTTATNQKSDSEEWIGPNPDAASSSHPLDSLTPTPKPSNSIGSAGSVTAYQVPEQPSELVASKDPVSGDVVQIESSGEVNATVYSCAGDGRRHEHNYYHSQMVNPFLPTSRAPPQERKLTTTRPKANPQEWFRLAPKAPSPPLPTRRSPPVRLEPTHRPSHGPPMTSKMGSGYEYPMVPAPSPIPMHQTYSNPLPYPSAPPMIDHPANLLRRIGGVLPDIVALMDLYNNTHHLLMARDSHIARLQAQKAAEAQQQDARIERLTEEIESVLNKHAAQVRKLKDGLSELEEKHSQLEESQSKERRLKEEARAAHASFKTQQAEVEKQHEEDVHQMKQDFADEKANIIADHSARERDLLDRMQSEAHIAEETLAARIAEMTRKHEIDKQAHEECWLRHKQDIENAYAKMCRELENTISMQGKLLEDEQRNFSRARDGWDEERHQLKKGAEEQHQMVAAKHLKEIVDMQRTMEGALSRQQSEAQDTILKLRRENDELRHQLEATHAHYKSEIQGAATNLRREKEEYAKVTDAALSRQKLELQDTIRQLQKDKEDLLRSRMPSQSRQNTESGETISKLQREIEVLRAGLNTDKAKWNKPATESTPAPKEDKNKLKRASGIYGSGTSLKSKGASLEQQSRVDGNRGHF